MATTHPSNITRRGQARRALSGVAFWTGGVLTVVWLYPRDLHWVLGLATLPLFLLGSLGVIQALTKT